MSNITPDNEINIETLIQDWWGVEEWCKKFIGDIECDYDFDLYYTYIHKYTQFILYNGIPMYNEYLQPVFTFIIDEENDYYDILYNKLENLISINQDFVLKAKQTYIILSFPIIRPREKNNKIILENVKCELLREPLPKKFYNHINDKPILYNKKNIKQKKEEIKELI